MLMVCSHFGEWCKVEETVVVLSVSLVRSMLCSGDKDRTNQDSFQTDDVGVFGSPLSNEYALVAQYFGLGRAEICALVRKGVDVIFGGEEEKRRLRNILWKD